MAFLFLAYPSENKLSRQKIHRLSKNTLGLRMSCPKVEEMAVKCVISSVSVQPEGGICSLSVLTAETSSPAPAILAPCGTSAPTLTKMVARDRAAGCSGFSTAVITTLAWRKTTSVVIQNSAQANCAKLPRIEDQGYHKHTNSAFCQEWKPATIYSHKSLPPAPEPLNNPECYLNQMGYHFSF